MIVGIINGYYRSGTTLMQRLYKLSNPNHIVLSEPTQHEIIDHVLANGCFKPSVLHGWNIFEDYCRLPREVKHEFIRRHFVVFDDNKEQWGIMTSEGAVRYLLQPLHDCKQPVVIKSNQLHLFLDKLREWYNCWILHLNRKIEYIVADHFDRFTLSNPKKAKDILSGKKGAISFYCDLVYDNLKKYLRINKDIVRNNLDKLVFNIMATKKVVEKMDNVVVLNFDEFVSNPVVKLNKLPFKVDRGVLHILDKSKKNPVPDWLWDMILDSVNYISEYINV